MDKMNEKTRDIVRIYLKENPAAKALDITRFVYTKLGKPIPNPIYPLSGTMIAQVKQELGISTRLRITKKKRGRPVGSGKKTKDDAENFVQDLKEEKKKYKQRLYYTFWERPLINVPLAYEKMLIEDLKDLVSTLNKSRHTKFEILEIASPKKIEIRETN